MVEVKHSIFGFSLISLENCQLANGAQPTFAFGSPSLCISAQWDAMVAGVFYYWTATLGTVWLRVQPYNRKMQKRMSKNGENGENGEKTSLLSGSWGCEAGNQRQEVPCGASAGPTGAPQAIVKSVLRISRHRMRM